MTSTPALVRRLQAASARTAGTIQGETISTSTTCSASTTDSAGSSFDNGSRSRLDTPQKLAASAISQVRSRRAGRATRGMGAFPSQGYFDAQRAYCPVLRTLSFASRRPDSESLADERLAPPQTPHQHQYADQREHGEQEQAPGMPTSPTEATDHSRADPSTDQEQERGHPESDAADIARPPLRRRRPSAPAGRARRPGHRDDREHQQHGRPALRRQRPRPAPPRRWRRPAPSDAGGPSRTSGGPASRGARNPVAALGTRASSDEPRRPAVARRAPRAQR